VELCLIPPCPCPQGVPWPPGFAPGPGWSPGLPDGLVDHGLDEGLVDGLDARGRRPLGLDRRGAAPSSGATNPRRHNRLAAWITNPAPMSGRDLTTWRGIAIPQAPDGCPLTAPGIRPSPRHSFPGLRTQSKTPRRRDRYVRFPHYSCGCRGDDDSAGGMNSGRRDSEIEIPASIGAILGSAIPPTIRDLYDATLGG
jgi:hypothetical protein